MDIEALQRLEKDLKRFAIEKSLARWKRLYDMGGNPLYAWQARNYCRAMGEPSPEWVERYLDKTGDRLLGIKPRPKEKDLAGRVAEAIGLHTSGGPSYFKQLKSLKLREDAVNMVAALRERRDKAKERDPNRRKPALERFKYLQAHGKIKHGAHSRMRRLFEMLDRQITNAEINEIVATNFEVEPRTVADWWRKHGPRKA